MKEIDGMKGVMRLRGGGEVLARGVGVVLRISLINVQGLTDVKMVDVCRLLEEEKLEGEVRIIGLVETHEKYRKIDWRNNISVMSEMKPENDKKGGSLSFVT